MRRHTNYLTDVGPAFGTYVHCTVPNTNNTMESRTEGCIMLMPKDSRDTAAYLVLKLSTGKVVARSHFTELPIPDALINHINTIASREGIVQPINGIATYNSNPPSAETTQLDDPIPQRDDTLPLPLQTTENQHDMVQQNDQVVTLNDDMQQNDQVATPNDDNTDHEQNGPQDGTHDFQDEEVYNCTTNRRRSPRLMELEAQEIADATAAKYDFAGTNPMIVDNITLLTVKQAIAKLGDPARAAITVELTSLINKGTFQPVHQKELTEAQLKAVIGSKMFVKEKTNPDGTIDKVKARLVAEEAINKITHYIMTT